jgi:hypothetical protein
MMLFTWTIYSSRANSTCIKTGTVTSVGKYQINKTVCLVSSNAKCKCYSVFRTKPYIFALLYSSKA